MPAGGNVSNTLQKTSFQQCEGTDHTELITQLLIMACVCTWGRTGVFVCMSEVGGRKKDGETKRGKGF